MTHQNALNRQFRAGGNGTAPPKPILQTKTMATPQLVIKQEIKKNDPFMKKEVAKGDGKKQATLFPSKPTKNEATASSNASVKT